MSAINNILLSFKHGSITQAQAASEYARPHVQSQFQIGYVPPLQHMAPGSAKPRGRYWLILVCVLVTVACINATAPSEQVPATTIAGK